MRKLSERIIAMSKRTKIIAASVAAAVIVSGAGIGFVNANEIGMTSNDAANLLESKVSTDVSDSLDTKSILGDTDKKDAKTADADKKTESTTDAKADTAKASETAKTASASTNKSDSAATANATSKNSSASNSTSTASTASNKNTSTASTSTTSTTKSTTTTTASHTHNWVPVYDKVLVTAAYDEPIYENQPVYETQPVYGEVTKYRQTTICSCGAIGVTMQDVMTGKHMCGGAISNYQEPYTETVQTGTTQVQVGTQQVQVGTKHHDAVYEQKLVGYKCSCGATK